MIHIFSGLGSNLLLCGLKRNYRLKNQGALIPWFAKQMIKDITCKKCKKRLK